MNESAPATKAKRSSKQKAPKLAGKASVNSSMVIREASIVSVAPVSSDAGDVSTVEGFDIGDHVQGLLALATPFGAVFVVIKLFLSLFFS